MTFNYKTTILNVADMFLQKLLPSLVQLLHEMQISIFRFASHVTHALKMAEVFAETCLQHLKSLSDN